MAEDPSRLDETDEYDDEDEFEPADDGDPTQGFAIGTVVFPVERIPDWVDPTSVLVNPVDSYIGKFVGKFLSDKVVGTGNGDSEDEEEEFEGENDGDESNSKYWKILGVFKEAKSQIPNWLWAVMQAEDYEAYLKDLLKCSVVIYDVTDNPTMEKFEEIRSICDALRAKVTTFKTRRVFILISSLHSWSHTKPPDDDGDAYFTEEDYRRRRTKLLYRDLQLLERYVVASGKMTKGMLKAYVIGAGAVYGAEEGPMHHWFKSAWHHAKYLPIYGSGKNYMPTIYIKDLASIIQNVMDFTPRRQRYILAVDPFLCQQDQIVQGISKSLGTGAVKNLPEEDIYLNKQLTTFQADQLLLDLKIDSTFCRDNFNVEFSAEKGMAMMMKRIAAEYKKSRNLEPLKLCLLGPPGVGKSTVARQISDMYRLNHFTKEDMISSTIELLREIAGDGDQAQTDPDNSENDVSSSKDDNTRELARNLLAQVDSSLGPGGGANNEETEGEDTPLARRKSMSHLNDELVCKLYRYRLLTNQCQNQGFILDGFPNTGDQARLLFLGGDDLEEMYGEEPGEDGKDQLDPRIYPDKVVILEAPDEFLVNRLLTIPTTELQERHQDKAFPGLLQEYRKQMEDYENSFLYYMDLQEMIYYPIDVSDAEGGELPNIVLRISDLLGRPRNYGLTAEQEEALRNVEQLDTDKMDDGMNELESKEMEDRRNNIQQWMEKLAKIKREEFEREEAALIPLRHYLMAHVVPTLTKGLLEVTRVRPFDPVEFLAEFMFQHNPGSINQATAQAFREETAKKRQKPFTHS